MYKKEQDSKIILILVYVDLIITSGCKKLIQDNGNMLKSRFNAKQFGFPTKFLGLIITKSDDQLFLHQTQFVNEMLKEFRMQNSNSVDTPIVPQGCHKVPDVANNADFPYKKAIGSLLHFSLFTIIYDILFDLGYLARFQAQQYPYNEKKKIFNFRNFIYYTKAFSSYHDFISIF